MPRGDILGFLGLILGVFGVALAFLYPTKRAIGYVFLAVGAIVGIWWGYEALHPDVEPPPPNIRPWVGVASAILRPTSAEGDFEWLLVIQNTGQTPGMKVRIGSSTILGGAPSLYRQLTAISPKDFKLEYDALLQGVTRQYHSRGRLTAEQVKLSNDPANLMRLIGRIDYEDDHQKDYSTTFCYVRRPDGNPTVCDELNDMK